MDGLCGSNTSKSKRGECRREFHDEGRIRGAKAEGSPARRVKMGGVVERGIQPSCAI